MRILVLANKLSGLMSFRKEVMKSMTEKGYEVYISVPYDKNYADQVRELGVKIINTEIDRRGINPITDLRLIRHYKKLVREIKPDAVLSYTIKPNLYGGLVCKWAKVPQLVNITGLGTAVENPGLLQKLVINLYKFCLKKVRVMFFQNKANMEFCRNHGMINGRPELLPGSGVNLSRFVSTEMPKDAVIKFICIGRAMKQKGTGDYLDMAEIIKKENSNTEFHLLGACGDGEYEERIMQLHNNGTIIYDGVTTDVRPYIQNVHCTVHASYYPEGMSNVLLESCASGRAIITTIRPGCGEIVVDGVNGFVTRPHDVEDLCLQVRKFLALNQKEREAMGRAAREKVEKEFDRQIVVDKYLKEIENLGNFTQ